MSVYAIGKDNNYFETMTKEQIIAAIQTAAAGGSLEGFNNCAFVSCIKEINKNSSFSVWIGTKAEYNAIAEPAKNVLYLFTDDPLREDLPNAVDEIKAEINKSNNLIAEHDLTISNQSKKISDQNNTLQAQANILSNHDVRISENANKISDIAGVEYTALFSGDNTDYYNLSGVTLSGNYDLFDFLIFEFREITDNGVWKGHAIIPTFELKNNTKYGLKIPFGATQGLAVLTVDTEHKDKLYFTEYSASNSKMSLCKVLGYIKKKEA